MYASAWQQAIVAGHTLCALDYIINSGTFMVHFVSLFVVSICLLHIVFGAIIIILLIVAAQQHKVYGTADTFRLNTSCILESDNLLQD